LSRSSDYTIGVHGKVFVHILLAWIQPLLDRTQKPEQSGIKDGRSRAMPYYCRPALTLRDPPRIRQITSLFSH